MEVGGTDDVVELREGGDVGVDREGDGLGDIRGCVKQKIYKQRHLWDGFGISKDDVEDAFQSAEGGREGLGVGGKGDVGEGCEAGEGVVGVGDAFVGSGVFLIYRG